jgi:gliding motility associated protien GldN
MAQQVVIRNKQPMKQLVIIGIYFVAVSVSAQKGGPWNVDTNGIVNGPYVMENIITKRMIPYEPVREADVIWSKRVWRTIDLREKFNHPLYLPFDEHTPSGQYYRNNTHWSLWTVLRQHILTGDLKVFSSYNPYQESMLDGDQLKYPIYAASGKNYYTDSVFRDKIFYYLGKLGAQSDIPLTDSLGNPIEIRLPNGDITFQYPDPDTIWIDSKEIVQYHIKEDWFFDKERSIMDVRIIAIAPVVYDIQLDPNGKKTINGTKELFWLYFPHCRFVLNNYYAYNAKNDAQWMSFDDLFWKRQFISTIYKESNVFDRSIDSYRSGIDALLESEKINEEIRTFESDVWNF